MDELREVAKAYYECLGEDYKCIGEQFFKRMDHDGDGQISLHEFLAFAKNEGHTKMANPSFFKELDKNGTGNLDFMDAITLSYIIESGRKFCDGCGEFIKGIFFSCMECFDHEDMSFNLCSSCFKQGQYVHSHKKFFDNFVLLETKRLDALKEKKAAKRKQRLEAEKQRLEREIMENAPIPVPEPVIHQVVVYNPHQGNNWLHELASFAAAAVASKCSIM